MQLWWGITRSEGPGDELYATATSMIHPGDFTGWDGVVRPEGLEPPTLGSEVRCSIQLSYGRARLFQTLRRRPCQERGEGTASS